MSVQMLDERDLCVLVTFAARHALLTAPAGETTQRLHQLNWSAYAQRYGPQNAYQPITFDWVPADPGTVFGVAGLYLYNVPDAHVDLLDLLRRIRKTACGVTPPATPDPGPPRTRPRLGRDPPGRRSGGGPDRRGP